MADDTGDARKRKAAIERSRQWRLNNPERVRELNRKSRRRKREKTERERERNRQSAARWYEEHKPIAHARDMARRHGPNWQMVFAAFWREQEGCCYLCGDPLVFEKYNSVTMDHDHDCCPQGKSCQLCRRGLACYRCNILIAYAQDDPARLRRIAEALEAATALVQERMSKGRCKQGEMF